MNLEPSTEFKDSNIALLEPPRSYESENKKINPLQYGDVSEYREPSKIVCGCPCPKISAPIFAAGYVIFDPLD